ncbi:sulfatase-like hydrolase/transferase [uncultured Algibacter sp.]|uniref:phosphoethanolamine transferase n=1 Tax=uncultured Algibacter sp. TaxID=298659 RepID=UPI00261D5662|nr:sulfatase-like hydrolase/transferase [uncultured Algibacter sp.]
MKVFNTFFLKYLVLTVLVFVFDLVFNPFNLFSFFNFIENVAFGATLVIPIFFFSSSFLKTIYFKLSYIFFAICLYAETVYYYLFKAYFSPSSIFVTLDTNTSESKEFLSFYVDTPIVILGVLLLSITVFFLFKRRLFLKTIKAKSKSYKLKIVALFLLAIVAIRQTRLINFNLPYLILISIVDYSIEAKKLGDYQKNKEGNFKDVFREAKNDEEVYVVLIGESTTRSHMGIYNYHRETTPRLDSIKKDLLIYENVISPHAYSVGALTKILTLGNYENPKRTVEGSIVQLINSAGFETYWVSNQRPIGAFESLITKISLSSNNHKFLTTTVAGNSKVLDDALLEPYKEILKNKSRKKVIFLHMMGTHHHYENRYPRHYNKFKDAPKTKFKSQDSFEKINHYDNAILYNDFIISEVIKSLDSLAVKSFVLYFSDHGEEMYSNINMAGHNEDIYSKQMFDIPFFLWQSKKYKAEENISFEKNRKYMTDDVFHSLANLLNISAREVDTTRSIFNKNFKERTRVIKDTINYDTYFEGL